VADEPRYRREEDRKWRESVEARLVSLTSAQKTTDDQLDDFEERLNQLDEFLEGKPNDKNDNGIKGDIKDLSVGLNTLRAIMAPDQLGQGGVIARLKTLERAAGIEEKSIENRWKFWTALAVAIAGSITALVTNLDRIEPYLKKAFGKAEVAVTSSSARHSTARRSRRRRVETPPPEEHNDGAGGSEVSE
jgi:hypothetical protein